MALYVCQACGHQERTKKKADYHYKKRHGDFIYYMQFGHFSA